MQNNNQSYENSWHLDKKIPISLFVALFIQAGTFIWFASNFVSQVDNNTEILKSLQDENTRQWNRIESNDRLIAELNGELGKIQGSLNGIEKQVNLLVKLALEDKNK